MGEWGLKSVMDGSMRNEEREREGKWENGLRRSVGDERIGVDERRRQEKEEEGEVLSFSTFLTLEHQSSNFLNF